MIDLIFVLVVTTEGGIRGRRQLYVVKQSDYPLQIGAYHREMGRECHRSEAKYYKDKGFEFENLNIMCVGQGYNRTYIYAAPQSKAVVLGITDMKTTWSSVGEILFIVLRCN